MKLKDLNSQQEHIGGRDLRRIASSLEGIFCFHYLLHMFSSIVE